MTFLAPVPASTVGGYETRRRCTETELVKTEWPKGTIRTVRDYHGTQQPSTGYNPCELTTSLKKMRAIKKIMISFICVTFCASKV